MHYDSVKAPIVVSVTGHKDIPEDRRAQIKDELRSYLQGLSTSYPHSDIILMTAMTDGSDLIAASVAIDLGLYIAPVFSVESESYRKMFSTDSNMKDFESILSYDRCLESKIISPSSDNQSRRLRELGAFLVSYSHIMITLWDGRSYSKDGGTYSFLKMAYNGCDWVHFDDYRNDIFGSNYLDMANNQLFDSKTLGWVDNCLVYWIQVDRASQKDYLVEQKGCLTPDVDNTGLKGYILPELYKVEYDSESRGNYGGSVEYSVFDPHYASKHLELTVDKEIPSKYGQILSSMDLMNAELEEFETDTYRGDSLLSFDGIDDTDSEVRSEMESIKSERVMSACAKRFAATDSLAEKYERKWYKFCITMLLLNLINSIQFSLFILFDKNVLSGIIFLFTTVLVLVVNYVYASANYHRRFVHYRCLAEMLRVNYYRGLIGIRCRLSENYNDMVKSDLVWTLVVMRSWQGYFMNDVPAWNTFDKKSRVEIVKKCWLEERLNHDTKTEYGDAKGKSMMQRYGNRKAFALMNRCLNLFSIIISITSIFMVIYLMWCFEAGYPIEPIIVFDLHITFEVIIKSILIAMMAVLTSITVLAALMLSLRSNRNDAKIKTFRIAKRKLERSYLFDQVVFSRMSKEDVDILILKELGDLTLKEIHDWTNGQLSISIRKKNTLDTHGLV